MSVAEKHVEKVIEEYGKREKETVIQLIKLGKLAAEEIDYPHLQKGVRSRPYTQILG